MDTRRRALGKGLEQLFNDEAMDIEALETSIIESASPDEIIEVPLSDLRSNPYQPRKKFDETALAELTNSIREHGVFQPIIINKSIKGYEIVAGERRVRASINAGLTTIPAIVRDFTKEQMMEIALLENLQREDLTAIEEAWGYQSIIDNLEITQEELAKKVGKSRSHITNIIGLLRLTDDIQGMIQNNQISMGHARVLSKLEDHEQIRYLASEVVKQDLSVRQLEELASGDKFKRKVVIATNKHNPYHYIEEGLKEKLGTKVKISDRKIEISFVNSKDLARILEIINVNID